MPMKHEEREALLKSLAPDQLFSAAKAKGEICEQTYRYALLMLLGDIASHHDSLAACYRKMLAIQESKTQGGR